MQPTLLFCALLSLGIFGMAQAAPAHQSDVAPSSGGGASSTLYARAAVGAAEQEAAEVLDLIGSVGVDPDIILKNYGSSEASPSF